MIMKVSSLGANLEEFGVCPRNPRPYQGARLGGFAIPGSGGPETAAAFWG